MRSRSVRWDPRCRPGRSGVGDPHCDDPAGLLAAGAAAGRRHRAPGPAHRLRARALRVVRRLPRQEPRYRARPGPVAPRLLPLPHLRAWDGAPWIWNLATAILPEATPIVDLYHARQHVHDLAGQLAPALGEHHSDWLTARLVDLDSGDIETLVQQPIGQHTGHT
ncbi:hypothetical protein X456_02944 [Mycobacterium tuberculosis XTB13-278]|uniref:hypothetical protein n=1 Tax=Mycobacterium tuberculosis TaxID=1773 RepID=UPI00045B3EF6|nr:hypothetical protein [Mycobacterium tuberculosis]KBS78719.1 hypothetical protein X456_02944 [Mycobacterium tuberculosis XTB13-278]